MVRHYPQITQVKQNALIDDIAPNVIENIIFNENGQNFTAQAEANSKVEVKNTVGEVVGFGYVDGAGNVSGYLNQVYLKGEELAFVVIDQAGNRSVEVKQTAFLDNTAPENATNLVFSEDGSYLTYPKVAFWVLSDGYCLIACSASICN